MSIWIDNFLFYLSTNKAMLCQIDYLWFKYIVNKIKHAYVRAYGFDISVNHCIENDICIL